MDQIITVTTIMQCLSCSSFVFYV